MSIDLKCPRCGTIYRCDHCHKVIHGERIAAKVVVHRSLAATPEVWGDFCSLNCLSTAISIALGEKAA